MQLSDFAAANNLVRLFLDRADALGDAPFLTAKRDGKWQSLSWTQAAQKVCLLAEGLRRMGLQDGDRVVLVSENRPEWCIADLAIMAAGCITTPAYITNTERDHVHILSDSGARAVIVSTAKLAKPLLPAITRTGIAEHAIGMEKLRSAQSGSFSCHQWDDLLQGDPTAARSAVDQRIATIKREDTACIIYTSGTGGAPRGVMQHHGAILSNVDGAATLLDENFHAWDHRFLSFLPLSHAYEHTAGQFLPIGLGSEIWYAEGLDKLAGNIEEASPTLMIVVPRLFEVLRTRMMKQIAKQGKVPGFLLDKAIALAERQSSGKTRPGDRLLDLLLEKTLRPKIRARFGGRMNALISGGAPLNPDVGRFFQALGLIMLQGYGQTEAAPVISCNHPGAGIKLDTVGPPLKDVEVRIADDGEILVRGELIMHGYWRNPAETARALQNGWLHTGDIGHFDDGGRIKITDRKKDMIVNDKGDNIAPQKVEGMLTLQPEIGQAMIAGEQKPYVVGLIVPDEEWAMEWASANGAPKDLAALKDDANFRQAIRDSIDRVNRELSVTEKVRQFVFADTPFTIQNEQLTPSLKIRRHKIREQYGARMDSLYRS
ncbi:long-chain fatty acid--CoA ligase [Altericroceibacterium spongiae]|uniref:Long-chain fatty acid--CoA ligase n=1 Tax=Altericroceibacterium spongiae TaxID=2320269 RepID=A0A420EE83_9SPHN|nr:AMP-dependent synthetase/ligase [Altericroceibacterium spongiae]RKF19019.1 long-chain fatty acid--CoA ligase [Altericroceibacterium spongiae]